MKRVLSVILALATLICACAFTVSATNYGKVSNYTSSNYSTPSNSGDYAYWNGSKVVKSSSTTTKEIMWMQASLNYCIDNKKFSASKLDVDGSFGPASKTTTTAFQKKFGLSADGSFGPATIQKMKSVLSDIEKSKKATTNNASSNTSTQTTTNSSSKTYLWPCSANASITGKYGTDRGDHIHAGIDIGLAKNAPVYATCAGVVIAVKNDSSGQRGRYVVVYHKDLNVSSLYQHLQSTCVSVGSNVSQGQTVGKAGGSGYGKDSYYANHLHFELKKGKQTTSNSYNFDPTPNKVIKYKNK